MYEIKNLEHRYQTDPVLQIGALHIAEHTITGLLGDNGSGKTTLLKLLAFIEKPTRGQIRFLGRPGAPYSDHVRFRVCLLPQDPYLMRRTVYDNVAYGLKIRKDTSSPRRKVEDALSWVGLSSKTFATRYFSELSGGEAQRVALAARLVLKPKALLLDEPTANVDAQSAELIREAALHAREQWGATLIVASHDRQWLYEISDTVLHVNRGRVFRAGTGNLVEGPWVPFQDGLWAKHIDDRQRILAPAPPNRNAVALLPQQMFHQAGRKADVSDAEANTLTGTVTGLILNRRTGEIMAAIKVGGVNLTATFTKRQAAALNLFPGSGICFTYKISDMKWL